MPRPAPPTPMRARLIAEALAFVRAVGGVTRSDGVPKALVPGVSRIALVGSLTTEKPDPKDADLLVTVADDADLGPLAGLGRRLKGRAQSLNRGADIFLADPDGAYLGRICHWTRCGPGYRMSCDAANCGRRPYLHDDLGTIRLPRALIKAPPIELWPEVVARVPIPPVVASELIAPLKG